MGQENRWGLQLLRNFLQDTYLNDNEDLLVWGWENSGSFSVKSMYRFLNDEGTRSKHAMSIWETKCPLKVRLFLWLESKNSVLAWDNL